jgi:hypothetical protein
MIQIFQFDQAEVCAALLDHINTNLGHKFSSNDLSVVNLKTVLPDGSTEYLNGQIQLSIGESDAEDI